MAHDAALGPASVEAKADGAAASTKTVTSAETALRLPFIRRVATCTPSEPRKRRQFLTMPTTAVATGNLSGCERHAHSDLDLVDPTGQALLTSTDTAWPASHPVNHVESVIQVNLDLTGPSHPPRYAKHCAR
ncbi:hypothetical protein GCM10010446_01030 [Streptomyces enissocaesilis]|uniref:Uncharacterized protein n=1 Tax=Streptomyces enissocaesilis TaxID=332589 RepID=A0ABP6J4I8_9ACTN